jgi:hypothetical protein
VFPVNKIYFPVCCVTVLRKFLREISVCVTPGRDTIYRLVRQCEEAEMCVCVCVCVRDERVKGRDRDAMFV